MGRLNCWVYLDIKLVPENGPLISLKLKMKTKKFLQIAMVAWESNRMWDSYYFPSVIRNPILN